MKTRIDTADDLSKLRWMQLELGYVELFHPPTEHQMEGIIIGIYCDKGETVFTLKTENDQQDIQYPEQYSVEQFKPANSDDQREAIKEQWL